MPTSRILLIQPWALYKITVVPKIENPESIYIYSLMWIQPIHFPYEKIFYTMVNWLLTNRVTWE